MRVLKWHEILVDRIRKSIYRKMEDAMEDVYKSWFLVGRYFRTINSQSTFEQR